LGFTQRGAVFVIYGIAATFAFISILLNKLPNRWGIVVLGIAVLVGLELFIELVGVLGENRQPLMKLLKFIGNSSYREEVLAKRKQNKK